MGFGLSEGGSLPSGVGGVSSKAAASIFVPSIAVPSRPPRSFWISQIYRSSVPLSLSLSRPHLANDEAHALYHGYACSESTSASLRPKYPSIVNVPVHYSYSTPRSTQVESGDTQSTYHYSTCRAGPMSILVVVVTKATSNTDANRHHSLPSSKELHKKRASR